jgi:hypothetical protein
MKKLTPEELREPDITLTIPYDRIPKIPAEVWKELRPYIGKDTGAAYVYKIPGYLARQLLEVVHE